MQGIAYIPNCDAQQREYYIMSKSSSPTGHTHFRAPSEKRRYNTLSVHMTPVMRTQISHYAAHAGYSASYMATVLIQEAIDLREMGGRTSC